MNVKSNNVEIVTTLSFNPSEDKILGVIGRYMFIEIHGSWYGIVKGADINDVEVHDTIYVLRLTVPEFQKLFKKWLEGKKKICESYGHWCGVFGDIQIVKFEILHKYGKTYVNIKDNNPNINLGVISTPADIIKVIEWGECCDFEHG